MGSPLLYGLVPVEAVPVQAGAGLSVPVLALFVHACPAFPDFYRLVSVQAVPVQAGGGFIVPVGTLEGVALACMPLGLAGMRFGGVRLFGCFCVCVHVLCLSA